MMAVETIAAAGNTEIPAFLILRSLGFKFTCVSGLEYSQWTATRSDLRLVGGSMLELLGLYAMRRERGSDWKAPDEEIESLSAQSFYPPEDFGTIDDDVSTGEETAQELYRGGRELTDAGAFEAAIQPLAQSAFLDPRFNTLELVGECYLSIGRLREAVVPLAAATSLSDESRAPALLADALCKLGDSEQAIRLARLALLRSPSNTLARTVLESLGVSG
jgi:tetratricopeptide (TPR) repeat protein